MMRRLPVVALSLCIFLLCSGCAPASRAASSEELPTASSFLDADALRYQLDDEAVENIILSLYWYGMPSFEAAQDIEDVLACFLSVVMAADLWETFREQCPQAENRFYHIPLGFMRQTMDLFLEYGDFDVALLPLALEPEGRGYHPDTQTYIWEGWPAWGAQEVFVEDLSVRRDEGLITANALVGPEGAEQPFFLEMRQRNGGVFVILQVGS